MRKILMAGFALFLLGGCGPSTKPFHSVDITGITGYGQDFRLVDHFGKPRTMADFRGKVVAIFFGYTTCPDVCPTTLSDMRQVMQRLGSQSEKLQVVFITVDRKRDTVATLGQYVPSFHPTFIGLTGDDSAIKETTRAFKIIARVVDGKTPDTYTVDHTAGMFVFDPQGRLRLMVPYGLAVEKVAEDIKRLM